AADLAVHLINQFLENNVLVAQLRRAGRGFAPLFAELLYNRRSRLAFARRESIGVGTELALVSGDERVILHHISAGFFQPLIKVRPVGQEPGYLLILLQALLDLG